MLKTIHVAWREFCSTVLTKGFIIGVLMTPVFILIVAGGIALVTRLPKPRLTGSVAVIDQAGGVAERIRSRFSKEAVEREHKAITEKVTAAMKEKAAIAGVSEQQADMAAGLATSQLIGKADLAVEVLAPDTDVSKAKAGLADVDVHDKARDPNARIALAVVPLGAIRADDKAAGGAGDSGAGEGGTKKYADFEVFTAPRVDPDIQRGIEIKVAAAIVDARIAADPRVQSAGLTPEQVRALVSEPEAKVLTVTKTGDKKGIGELQMLIPMAFMLLLLMSVMTGGQYLLTTTVEEKASRVMEVLLSAVSPMQLMVGKICGQMCVGLLILLVYSGAGVGGLAVFKYMHILNPMLLVYLVLFFFIAFFIIASMMAAAGSAVSEMREAQTLMSPIMVIIMLPWLLWMPISRSPNSLFSTVMSFVPGINPFVMMIRLCGSEPPPTWQIPVSILIGLLSVLFCAWAAAKIFRIGVLMYGKPPNLRTLIRWVRMA